jgi:two-component system, response regulator PdtaR
LRWFRPILALVTNTLPLPEPETAPPSTDRRVLIAEDETLVRMDLAEMLTELGYTVVGQAKDGAEAVRLAVELSPEVTVLDVKMPSLDGISAAEQIGEQTSSAVVMLTAFSQRDLVLRARDAGAMAYLVKPFTADDLVPAIEVALARHEQIASLTREVADLSERLESRKAIERAKSLLQTRYRLDEPGAFRWIQKTAMDMRVSMRRVAEMVIAEALAAPATDEAPPADPASEAE